MCSDWRTSDRWKDGRTNNQRLNSEEAPNNGDSDRQKTKRNRAAETGEGSATKEGRVERDEMRGGTMGIENDRRACTGRDWQRRDSESAAGTSAEWVLRVCSGREVVRVSRRW